MKVAIDVTNFYFGLTNGTPIYLYNLVRAILHAAPEARLVLLYNHREGTEGREILDELAGPRVESVHLHFRSSGIPAGGWWYPLRSSIRKLIGDIDVYHAGDYVWPRRDETPTVVTIHDLTTKLFPECHWWANRWHDALKLRWATKAADRLIGVSESTKRDLVRLLGVDPERVDVVPEARGQRATLSPQEVERRVPDVRRRYGLGDAPYVLTVGTIEPRKNYGRLIHAYERVAVAHPDVRLVIAGGDGWKTGPIERVLENSPVRERIHRLGFVPSDDLQVLYTDAVAFAYPSLYEGFGLPVLEAMAEGVPVLTSNTSSLPEVAGDAALLVDPTSVDAIRSGLERLLSQPDLRADLSTRGREREQKFTWQRTAELTLESYRKAIAARQVEHGEGVRR